MKQTISALLLFIACSCTALAQENSAGTGKIRVTIDKLRNSDGLVGVSLYNTKQGFPDKPERALIGKCVVAGPHCEVEFDNVPYGTYAVSVLHDENSNRKMDKTFIGIPKEGFGTSNNPKIRRGPPSYSESQFTLNTGEVDMNISVNYF